MIKLSAGSNDDADLKAFLTAGVSTVIAGWSSKHLLTYHKGEDAQDIIKLMILDTAETLEDVLKLELMWTRKLFAFWPSGLNIREEESVE